MQQLTKAEEEIMQYIWKIGPCTVSQIIDATGKPDTPHSSVSSIVRILEKKGFVDHKAYGRTYEYYPLISKKEYSGRTLHQFLNKYFKGSPEALMSFLVEEKEVDVDALENILKDIKDKND